MVPAVQVEAVNGVGAGVVGVLRPLPGPHGVLVHGRVGLGRGVVARRQAVARLAAVVAVPVVHRAVLVVQGCGTEGAFNASTEEEERPRGQRSRLDPRNPFAAT